MPEITRNPRSDTVDDAAFLDAVVRYLDDSLSDEQVAEIHVILASDPVKAAAFVEICLSSKVIAESCRIGQDGEAPLDDSSQPDVAMRRRGFACWPVEDEMSTADGLTDVVVADLDNGASSLSSEYLSSISPRPTSWLGHLRRNVSISQGMSALVVFCVVATVAWRGPMTMGYGQGSYDEVSLMAIQQEFGRTHVARVSGMVDCQWATGESSPLLLDYVAAGRVFRLESGLLEITYHNGAKVILQGPATYELCLNGGYLISGKLAGRFTAKTMPRSNHGSKNNVVRIGGFASFDPTGGEQRISEMNDLPMIRTSSFVIRTPMTTVVDLGTEFGVEVDNEGTTSHVFRGSIELRPVNVLERHQECVLKENESMRVEMDQDRVPTMRRVTVGPDEFIRRLSDWRK